MLSYNNIIILIIMSKHKGSLLQLKFYYVKLYISKLLEKFNTQIIKEFASLISSNMIIGIIKSIECISLIKACIFLIFFKS